MQGLKTAGMALGILSLAVSGYADTKTVTPTLDGETHPVGSGPGAGSNAATGATWNSQLSARIYQEKTAGHISLTAAEFYEIAGDAATLYGSGRKQVAGNKDLVQIASRLRQTLNRRRLTPELSPEIRTSLFDFLDAVRDGKPLLPEQKTKFLTYVGGLLGIEGSNIPAPTSQFSGQLGIANGPGYTDAYGSVFVSTPEFAMQDAEGTRISFGLTGLEIPSVHAGGRPVTYRLGATASVGDPDRMVANLSYGEYWHPDIHDAEFSVSERIGENTFDAPHSGRKLFDYVRAGDIWVSGSLRSLSSQENGTAAEVGVTYGLRNRFAMGRYTDLAPTVTATVTYCAQKQLGLDEVGIEGRYPIPLASDTPVFLTARYGTRGTASVGFAFKFSN